MKHIDIDNQSNFTPTKTLLALLDSILQTLLQDLNLPSKSCELLFVDNAKIASINAEFRGVRFPTDVLSFPLESEFSPILGSIIISVEYAQEVSQKLKHTLEEEIALLFIHGILHLVGFDHETDNGEQRAKEEELVIKFHLPSSLIVRTQSQI
ncbi:rRNA maturation RNase YbeY [Helicobacter sp.]|uniref:rRNA maturation RNase YbeY n=1 Tax=Helicobacter sp. TaxID=218 RepID=UPI0019B7289C|nr:rRNA maturation RNase YbeY [Helicobacter sp.]MBD5165564.1 rRNA maturation RNase YbeY [Helicobacter sp.]